MTVTISNPIDGANEILTTNVSGTNITIDSFVGGVLTLSGNDTLTNYQVVLTQMTYENVSGANLCNACPRSRRQRRCCRQQCCPVQHYLSHGTDGHRSQQFHGR